MYYDNTSWIKQMHENIKNKTDVFIIHPELDICLTTQSNKSNVWIIHSAKIYAYNVLSIHLFNELKLDNCMTI